ncbi:hypothetical protein Cgig2_020026 [Carnegiea gigantea]|uniref:Uncharacterized protein n=1 Tax=Carnegiea gigantea TaxID=171969 RepID=A0A9Q1K2Z2_9CARY|nr:hypothetical protein Cgig2_020026 [Carnegiea gigantea]
MDVASVVVPEMPTLPCLSRTTQQSNVDPVRSTKSKGEECCQKCRLDGSTSTIGSKNSRGTKVKHTPIKSSISKKKQKAHNIDPTKEPIYPGLKQRKNPIFNVKNDQTRVTYSMDKLIGNDSFSEESGDSKHAVETELDLYAFEDIVGSIPKTRGERKINVNSVVDDDAFEHDGD